MLALATQRTKLLAVWLTCLAAPAWAVGGQPEFRQGKWPFHPPRRPAVPAVAHRTWVANPIDAFVLQALEARQLRPSSDANGLTLLRRVTFDLTGLPPSPAEQRAFLDDTSRDAYERVVDRLLDSPRYGERWAQHWLDVVRYAETDGFKEDAFRPNAHQYRDYVIRALNADLPYDRFVRQQLAGDELEPGNREALVATGLNRLYPDEYNAANVRQRRQEIHDDLTEATGLAFLGLTIGCAACHDHKFDPITQVDYYRLQAFFAPLLARDDLPLAADDECRQHAQRQAAWEAATAGIRSEIDALLAPLRAGAMQDALSKFDDEIRRAVETPPAARTTLQQQWCTQAMKHVAPKLQGVPGKSLKGQEKARYEALTRQLAEFDHLKPTPLPVAMAVGDAETAPPPTHVLAQGNFRLPLDEVSPGFPEFLGASQPQIESPALPMRSSGRRAALARWLTRPDHPLTARVMVNRVWHYHFGRGIVGTPNDFGAMGDPPSHPELLDWLTVEFIERGWSLKSLHRLIVTSSTYRQSSQVDLDDTDVARAWEADPDNRLLWHARRRRLEGEAIRDTMLALSGQLNARMFGPSARPVLPPGIEPRLAWKPDAEPSDQQRRSIYVFAKRNLRYPLLEIFDLPDMHNSCPQRSSTTTAPQALALLNSDFTAAVARGWSGRLLAEHGPDRAALVRAAVVEAFGRAADEHEVAAAGEFLAQQAELIGRAGQGTDEGGLPEQTPAHTDPAAAAAVFDFCHALLNANELVFID